MNDFSIIMENVSRDFITVKALKNISLQIPAGIVFGFLGPNGAGKTTAIRLLLGLLEPTAGKAQVLGYDTVRQPAEIRLRCGALLEHTGLYERLSAEDNLEFYGRVWNMPAIERKARIQELLTSLGLWDRRKEIVNSWSRGMKQKLAVARAMLHRPELIFLDEPTSGLDAVASATLREDLSSLVQQHGVTVFLTTHNLTEAEKLCKQIAVVRSGEMLLTGSPDELRMRSSSNRLEVIGRGFSELLLDSLKQNPSVTHLEMKDNHLVMDLQPNSDSAPLVQMIAAGGGLIDEVRKGKASLEEAFLDLVRDEDQK